MTEKNQTPKKRGRPAKSKKRVIPSNPTGRAEVLFLKDCKRIKKGEKRTVSRDTAAILRDKGFIK